jgi:hypothetical protein
MEILKNIVEEGGMIVGISNFNGIERQIYMDKNKFKSYKAKLEILELVGEDIFNKIEPKLEIIEDVAFNDGFINS